MPLLDEQQQLRATARSFFERFSAEEVVRTTMATPEGFDRHLWRLMADQLGLQGMLIPEKFGGGGLTFRDSQIVLEEMGRALVCAPFLSSAVLAVEALLGSHDGDACARLLPRIADGTLVAAVAFTDRQGRWNPAACATVRASRAGPGWALHGHRGLVLDGAGADLLLVAATTDSGPSLFTLDGRSQGLTATPLETLDATRRQADLLFDGAPANLVGIEGAADPPLTRALTAGLAGLAAEALGGARRAMQMSVDYAKIRKQFGRPIGSFQAIKHKCADMLLQVEFATSAVYAAGQAIDEGSEEAALLASLAKAYCSEAFWRVATETIQVHGGIGFTWEHSAHLYFRRAKSTQMLFGDPIHHREQVLKESGL